MFAFPKTEIPPAEGLERGRSSGTESYDSVGRPLRSDRIKADDVITMLTKGVSGELLFGFRARPVCHTSNRCNNKGTRRKIGSLSPKVWTGINIL
ncbi:unnamed protein product [Allacma fusca]|uniref:Uncharacterized protein n=1 Tax=Allacma fusca TaxID=39272 RepID=A0A8J2LAB8_9HEXA|nr:unnamed protein product [Allacma fusca]